MESKSWFLISVTRRSTSFTLQLSIKCSNTGWSWTRSGKGLNLTKVHGWHHTSSSTPNFELARAKIDFEKDFFKLMNNSVFGQMMDNSRKHMDNNLMTNEEAYLKRVEKLNFRLVIHFSENLHDGKDSSHMNKFIYLGQAILDLSKIVI